MRVTFNVKPYNSLEFWGGEGLINKKYVVITKYISQERKVVNDRSLSLLSNIAFHIMQLQVYIFIVQFYAIT